MINKVILVGRLGKDPEHKKTENSEICKFSIATSEVYYNENKEKVEKTEWHNIVVWGKLAGICKQYLKKGKQVYLEGKIRTRNYTKDEVKHYVTEIVAEEVKFLGDKE